MNTTLRCALSVGTTLAALCTLAAPAAAEETKSVTEHDDHYGYEFRDDLLQGGGLDATAPRITVLSSKRRDQLIRPRVHFVRELVKSVEDL